MNADEVCLPRQSGALTGFLRHNNELNIGGDLRLPGRLVHPKTNQIKF